MTNGEFVESEMKRTRLRSTAILAALACQALYDGDIGTADLLFGSAGGREVTYSSGGFGKDDLKAYPPRKFERGVRGEKAKPKVKKSGGRRG